MELAAECKKIDFTFSEKKPLAFSAGSALVLVLVGALWLMMDVHKC
jgi:hypothetical protein